MRKMIGGVEHLSRNEAMQLLDVAKSTLMTLREQLGAEEEADGSFWYPLPAVEKLAAETRAGKTLPPPVIRQRRQQLSADEPGADSLLDLDDGDHVDEPLRVPAVIRTPSAPQRQLAGPKEWTEAMRAGYLALSQGHPPPLLVSRYALDPRSATVVLEAYQSLAGATTIPREAMEQQVVKLQGEFDALQEGTNRSLAALGTRVQAAEAGVAAAGAVVKKLVDDLQALEKNILSVIAVLTRVVEKQVASGESNRESDLVRILGESSSRQQRALLDMLIANNSPRSSIIGFDVTPPSALVTVNGAANGSAQHLEGDEEEES